MGGTMSGTGATARAGDNAQRIGIIGLGSMGMGMARRCRRRRAACIFLKDLGLVLDTGRALRFPLPLTGAARQLFLKAAAAGLGSEDDAAVVKIHEKLAGISISGQEPP